MEKYHSWMFSLKIATSHLFLLYIERKRTLDYTPIGKVLILSNTVQDKYHQMLN